MAYYLIAELKLTRTEIKISLLLGIVAFIKHLLFLTASIAFHCFILYQLSSYFKLLS